MQHFTSSNSFQPPLLHHQQQQHNGMIMLGSNHHLNQQPLQYTSVPPTSTILQQPPQQPIYSVIPNTASHNFPTDHHHHEQQHLGTITQPQGMTMREVLSQQQPLQQAPLYPIPPSNLNYSNTNQPTTSHNAPFISGQSSTVINKRIRREDMDEIPKNQVFRKLKPIVRAATPSPIIATHQAMHDIIPNNVIMFNQQQPTYSEQFMHTNQIAIQNESIPMNRPPPSNNVQNTPQSMEGAFVNHHSMPPVPSHIIHQQQDPYHHNQQFHSLHPVHHQPVVTNSSPHNILQQPSMGPNQNSSSNQSLNIRQQVHAAFENQPLPKVLLRKLPNHVIDALAKKDPKIAQQLQELQDESILPQIHTPFRKTQELDLKDPNAGNNINSPVTIDDDTFMSNQVVEESVHPSILKLDEASFELIKSKRSDAHSTTNSNGDIVYVVEDDNEDEEHEDNEMKADDKHENHSEPLKQAEEDDAEPSDHLISDHGDMQKNQEIQTETNTSEIVPRSPVQIQSTLESEKHLSKVDLYSWSFVFEHVPNDKLYVYLMGKTSPDSDRTYKSSFIVHRINPKTVRSENETTYVLASEMNHERNSENLNVVGKEFLDKFCNSADGPFPKNWDDLLKKEFLRLEKSLTSPKSKNQTSTVRDNVNKSFEKKSPDKQKHFSPIPPQNDDFMDVGGGGFDNDDLFQPPQDEDDKHHHDDEPSPSSKKRITSKNSAKNHNYRSDEDEQQPIEEEDIPSDTPKKKAPKRKNSSTKKTPKKRKKYDISTDEESDEANYIPEEEEEKPRRTKKKNETITPSTKSKKLSQTSITSYSKSKKSKQDDSSEEEEDIPTLDVELEGKLMGWRKNPTPHHTPPNKKSQNAPQDIPIVHKYYYTPPPGFSKETTEESPHVENHSDEPSPKPKKTSTKKRKAPKFSTTISNNQDHYTPRSDKEEPNIVTPDDLITVLPPKRTSPRKPKNTKRRKRIPSQLDCVAIFAGINVSNGKKALNQ
ncbi:hypothetical protein FDP41_011338 [Naegleria fowleri]|uniref:SANTA domain-containing protein n=1 Tax=Naegleria fowleri TaxID=5763 RepID=A0A6A5C9P8_NAEFO|nr:uncharacterized protein FDP41_011338 [Naegleria fowleri]KAF0982408.1 hypothetical protein FDP41_011338 [Naegleria fowleri]CAG4719146.1 unnamed protein product [Naegleria fowleri]